MKRKFTARIDDGNDFAEITFVTFESDLDAAEYGVRKAMEQMGFDPETYDLSHQSWQRGVGDPSIFYDAEGRN